MKRAVGFGGAALLLLSAGEGAAADAAELRPVALRCEYRQDPLGIGGVRPRLSWTLQAPESARGIAQSGYRVLVASTPEALAADRGDLWDSGQVGSDQQAHIPYSGQSLTSRQRCHWKVRVWDQAGRPSGWSAPARWTVGLLEPGDWHAQWIGHVDPRERDEHLATAGQLNFAQCHWIWYPEGNPRQSAPAGTRFFRRSFDVPAAARVQSARLLLTVDQRYAVFLNGRLVRKNYDHGNSWMRAYETDVAELLVAGRNVLAIEAGSAGNRPAGAIAKLAVIGEAGYQLQVVTDGSWKAAREKTGEWTAASFDDAAWPAALDLGEIGIKPWGNHWTGWAQQAPSPLLRTTFTLSKPVRSAMLFACGLGYHELYLNGGKVGDHVLDPAFTRYDRRVLYVTHDVTSLLRQGRNALGVMLGNGWFNVENFEEWDFVRAPWRDKPKAIAQLEVVYADGTTERVVSDGSWRAATGPVRFDGIRNGEVYDARLERAGWDRPDYDDSGWAAATVAGAPPGRLCAQMLPPIRVIETRRPVKLAEPRPGVAVFDLGQNIAGWVQLKLTGPAGTRVTVRYGEKLTPEGRLDAYPIDCFVYQGPFQTDVYILKGSGTEVWEPRFSYHGFQFVEVTGFPGRPTLDSLGGRVVHTDFAEAGAFECSDALVNRIHQLARWSYRGNFHGYPTDCPHREKNGWAGDAHVFAETALFNFDMAAAFEKWLDDFRDERREDGQAAAIIPTSGWGYNVGPSWDSACVLIPWFLHVYSGDVRVLADNYDSMKRYVDFLARQARDHVVSYGLGDWMYPKTATPAEVTGTGYYFADAAILGKAAAILGKPADAQHYTALAEAIRAAFHARLYKGDGVYANGSQTAQSCPLWHGLVPETERAAVTRQLLGAIEKQNGHVDVGIIGIKYLLPALSQAGQDEIAYRLVTQTTPPGWGDWVRRGATTCWEDWAGELSHNHYAFGTVAEWFFKSLAGLNPDPQQPGFKHVIVRPRPVRELTWVRAAYDSARGRIESRWQRRDEKLRLEVTIPVNSTATVYVPTTQPDAVTESGQLASTAGEVKFLRAAGDAAVYRVGSGHYVFEAPCAP